MNIFEKIKNSIYNPKYYQEVLEKPFSYSFKYLLVFALLFALAFTIIATIKFIPIVNLLSQKAPELANYFPQELTVNIKDGKVSTNVQEPYFIKMPNDWKSSFVDDPKTSNMENLIVIDTINKLDLAMFNSYKTQALLTADSVVVVKSDGQITITSLSSIKDFTLNRDIITSLINIVKPFLVILYPVVFVGAYIGGFFLILLKMVYLLFGALLIWIIAKIKGMKIGYKGSYKVGMQLMTGAIIVTSILSVFSIESPIPFLFSILLIISAAINLKVEKISLAQ